MRFQDWVMLPNGFAPPLTGEGVETTRNWPENIGGRTLWVIDKRTKGVAVTRHCKRERAVHIGKDYSRIWKPLRSIPADRPPEFRIDGFPGHLCTGEK